MTEVRDQDRFGSGYVTDGLATVSEGQVTEGSKAIGESLENMASTITRLEDRLEAVLRPMPPEQGNDKLMSGIAGRSRLADELHGHSGRIADLTIRLQVLLSRIDL